MSKRESPIVRIASIKLENITVRYPRNVEALKLLSLVFEPGIYILVGPNGSGKTTLLDVVAGIRKPSVGRVVVNDTINLYGLDEETRASIRRETIAYMLQEDIFLDHLNVIENLKFFFKTIDENEVMTLMKKLGVESLANRYPATLSGGEKRKISFIRTYLKAVNSSLILLDEPTSHIDADSVNVIKDMILKLWEYDKKKIIIIATHDLELKSIAHILIELRAGHLEKVEKIANTT
ncbi:MAG: ABC transporter ATP-binding protein [Ignisphaera sp.]